MRYDLTFTFRNATKGTYRFTEDSLEGKEVIGTLYIKKTALDRQPQSLKVSVEVIA
jgi:hypothetical protein